MQQNFKITTLRCSEAIVFYSKAHTCNVNKANQFDGSSVTM